MKAEGEPWATLGLEPGAPSADIRSAYRQLAKRLHPDASKDPRTASRFDRVVKAYKTLTVRPGLPSGRAPRTEAGAGAGEDGKAGRSTDIFALGSVLATSKDPGERARAVTMLGLSGRRSAWLFLRKALFDRDERVQAAAVRSVAVLGLRQAGPELASLYARAPASLRAQIRLVAKGTAEPVFAEALRVARSEGDGVERLEAAAILASLGV
ncbi:MAG: DnaJ domain-containing protein [Spirochaetales bacterium]|nr:DnaJ domain-containing protein [Spirochaetales bacterium]